MTCHIVYSRPNESFEGRKGRDCWSSGWGADKYAGDVSAVLPDVAVMIVFVQPEAMHYGLTGGWVLKFKGSYLL